MGVKKILLACASIILLGLFVWGFIFVRHLEQWPVKKIATLRNGQVSTECRVDKDCLIVSSDVDFTQCTDEAICNDGDPVVGVNKVGYQTLATEKNFVREDCRKARPAGSDDLIGCPASAPMQEAKCFLLRCVVFNR